MTVMNAGDIEAGLVQERTSKIYHLLRMIFWGTVFIGHSIALVFLNKYLMAKERFPYALPLVTTQQIMICLFSFVAYMIMPSYYPTMESVKGSKMKTIFTVFPLAVCCCGTMVGSNWAYRFCSVALLQILKQGDVAIVFAFTIACGLEKFSAKVGLIILGLVVFCAAAVTGDVHFMWVGIVIQLVAQTFNAFRVIIIQFSTQANAEDETRGMQKLDPLTMVGVTAPVMCLLLVPACAILFKPIWTDAFLKYKWLLLVNSVIAFGLNASSMKFIQVSSSLHMCIAGVLKHILIVVLSSWIFSESLTVFQYFCFSICTVLVALHSIMGMYKKEFENSWSEGLNAFYADVFQEKLSIERTASDEKPTEQTRLMETPTAAESTTNSRANLKFGQ